MSSKTDKSNQKYSNQIFKSKNSPKTNTEKKLNVSNRKELAEYGCSISPSSSNSSSQNEIHSKTVKSQPITKFFKNDPDIMDAAFSKHSNVSSDKSSNANGYKEDPMFMQTLDNFTKNPKKAVKKSAKKENITSTIGSSLASTATATATTSKLTGSIGDILIDSHKRKQLEENKKEANKAIEFMARLKAANAKPIDNLVKMSSDENENDKEKEVAKLKLTDTNKESMKKMMTFIDKLKLEKPKLITHIDCADIEMSDDSESSSFQKTTSISTTPKRKNFDKGLESSDDDTSQATGTIDELSDIEVDETTGKKSNKPKRQFNYEAIDEDSEIEEQIDQIQSINLLNEKQIHYMVLRDINYFIDIFSGQCEHSWRHLEFKKYSKKSGNLLYESAVLSSFTLEQYTSAVEGLQEVFCKKDNKADEYIVKVLLPEALIKICMRVYQCSKEAAEEFLQKNNFKNNFKEVPRGSISR